MSNLYGVKSCQPLLVHSFVSDAHGDVSQPLVDVEQSAISINGFGS